MAVRSTVTMTPSGPGRTGSGTFSTVPWRGPCRTVARISARYRAGLHFHGPKTGPAARSFHSRRPMPRTLEPSTTVVVDEDIDAFFAYEDLWAVIVWNDDVTTFQTVIQAFVEIFHHSYEAADQLAWTTNRTGKAGAAIRPKEEAEADVRDLHR